MSQRHSNNLGKRHDLNKEDIPEYIMAYHMAYQVQKIWRTKCTKVIRHPKHFRIDCACCFIGFRIDPSKERLIVTLFADDTLLYLNEEDTNETIENILQMLCKATTANFNLEKTTVLPMGTKTYRDKVITHRTLNEEQQQPFEAGVRIVKDNKSMRTLGSWIGKMYVKSNQIKYGKVLTNFIQRVHQ